MNQLSLLITISKFAAGDFFRRSDFLEKSNVSLDRFFYAVMGQRQRPAEAKRAIFEPNCRALL